MILGFIWHVIGSKRCDTALHEGRDECMMRDDDNPDCLEKVEDRWIECDNDCDTYWCTI